MLASIAFNFVAGRELHARRAGIRGGALGSLSPKSVLVAAIAINLAALT